MAEQHKAHEHASCEINESCSSCGCGGSHEHKAGEQGLPAWAGWLRLAVAGAMLLGMIPMPEAGLWRLATSVAACLVAGGDLFWRALRQLLRGKLNESLLMLVSTVACLALGDYSEAAAIAIFFALGESIEELASARSRKSIAALAEIQPDSFHYKGEDGSTQDRPTEQAQIGDGFVVYPHERIPLDGKVQAGVSSVDASALTGESVPQEVRPGDAVLSGSINGQAQLTLECTAVAQDSAVSRILELVQNATQNKGNSERYLARLTKYYLPSIVLLAALLMLVPGALTGEWQLWIKRGLFVLVSACPCAIVLSVPLSFFAAIGGAAKQGVLVKGGRYIETFARCSTIAFDKTGTLTTDVFEVTAVLPQGDTTSQAVLYTAAIAEQRSTHPLGKAIVAQQGGTLPTLDAVQEHPGGGVVAQSQGQSLLCGSLRFLREQGIQAEEQPGAQVYVARGGVALGALRLAGALRPEAAKAVAALRKLGLLRIAVLSGDNPEAVQHAAEACGIDETYAELQPGQKLEHMRQLQAGGACAYVGDGINDAPVLAAADVGIAIGMGAGAASETADIVLLGTSLQPLVAARRLFRQAMAVVQGNVAFALLVKLGIVLAGMATQLPIWLAVVADVGVMVLTVTNAARLLRVASAPK